MTGLMTGIAATTWRHKHWKALLWYR